MMMQLYLRARFRRWIYRRCEKLTGRRPPDLILMEAGLGSDVVYLQRWHVLPRNRWFNVYYHHILDADVGRDLHDHPWINLSWVLRGGYAETTLDGRVHQMSEGAVSFRWPSTLHRISDVAVSNTDGQRLVGARTLFFTGPVVRDWGFLTVVGGADGALSPRWIPNKVYLEMRKRSTP